METEQEQKNYKCDYCLREFETHDDLNVRHKDDNTTLWICGDCQHKAYKDKYELITERHDNENNALIVDNYPYGFRLRTKIRYWIETTKNGDRFISQTLNPKTNKWNNPKKSTYCAVMVLTKEKKTGYIHYNGLYPSTERNAIIRFEDFIKGYELSKEQQEQIRILKAYSKAYENVTFEINPIPYNEPEAERLKREEEQKQVKESIKKSVTYHYVKQDF